MRFKERLNKSSCFKRYLPCQQSSNSSYCYRKAMQNTGLVGFSQYIFAKYWYLNLSNANVGLFLYNGCSILDGDFTFSTISLTVLSQNGGGVSRLRPSVLSAY